MLFYQGEDISLRLKGDSLVDFINNNFWILIYSAENSDDSLVFGKSQCIQNENANVYDCIITHEKTKDMIGLYNMEVLIANEEDKRSIYKQDGIFEVEFSYIKDEVNNESEE